MGAINLDEDRVGLLAAILLHLLLVAAIASQVLFSSNLTSPPQRMTVSLATEVSLESTAPSAVPESRAAISPTLGEESAVEDEQRPDVATEIEAAEAPPRRSLEPVFAPIDTSPRRRPEVERQPDPQPRRPTERAGGSRIGDNFLQGQGSATNTDETRIPANEIGRSARASLQQAINRQLRPYWEAPSGLDAEQLVTVLAFRLNEDGSLNGRPRVVRQSGVTDSNRPQAPLHAERAIRAVQRAAPFDLPDEYYNAWKNITEWRFDRRL